MYMELSLSLIYCSDGIYQCCGSGLFIPDPGSWFLPIPDPGSKNSNKREGWTKICCHTFLCSHKFHKIVNNLIFEMLKKKMWANFQRTIKLFTQKIVTHYALKNMGLGSWIRDPRSRIRDAESGIRKKPIPDPGSRGQKGTGPRIRIRNTGIYPLLLQVIPIWTCSYVTYAIKECISSMSRISLYAHTVH